HSIGGFHDAMYQQAACALLEHVIEFNHPCAEERYLRLEVAMFGSARGKGPLIDLLGELRRDLGADGGLESIGVRRGDIHRLSENAIHDPCLATNPRPAGRKEVEELYERAM
ncbi:MAG TPA: iron-containing alcohol dehydrogenase, partial [Methanomassiliicoccaceae archaeon]|nr:iron-containing alcohol dehydrogenase [Methanomassiliicoccaceae archaeon]